MIVCYRSSSKVESSSSAAKSQAINDEKVTTADESLLTSIMRDVNSRNQLDEPKQMQSVPVDRADSSAWNNSVSEAVTDRPLTKDPQTSLTRVSSITSSEGGRKSATTDSTSKLAFELSETQDTMKLNGWLNQINTQQLVLDRSPSLVKSDDPQITIIEPKNELVRNGNILHSDPSGK